MLRQAEMGKDLGLPPTGNGGSLKVAEQESDIHESDL